MKRARTFRAANAQMRQLGFGFVDLLLHTAYSPERDGDRGRLSRGAFCRSSRPRRCRRTTP